MITKWRAWSASVSEGRASRCTAIMMRSRYGDRARSPSRAGRQLLLRARHRLSAFEACSRPASCADWRASRDSRSVTRAPRPSAQRRLIDRHLPAASFHGTVAWTTRTSPGFDGSRASLGLPSATGHYVAPTCAMRSPVASSLSQAATRHDPPHCHCRQAVDANRHSPTAAAIASNERSNRGDRQMGTRVRMAGRRLRARRARRTPSGAPSATGEEAPSEAAESAPPAGRTPSIRDVADPDRGHGELLETPSAQIFEIEDCASGASRRQSIIAASGGIGLRLTPAASRALMAGSPLHRTLLFFCLFLLWMPARRTSGSADGVRQAAGFCPAISRCDVPTTFRPDRPRIARASRAGLEADCASPHPSWPRTRRLISRHARAPGSGTLARRTRMPAAFYHQRGVLTRWRKSLVGAPR